MDNNDWPLIELCPLKQGILNKFTNVTGEAVANVIIKELVDSVDHPSSSNADVFLNDQELEWIMQVINHGLTLTFSSDQSYETLRSAVRVYLAWSSSLTKIPHESCPRPILIHPDRYFRKILEAFRHIFQHKCPITSNDYTVFMNRQGTQILTILTAINQLTNHVESDYKDETWSRSLIFLINITDQLISMENCISKESIGCLMANDLCQNLFDCWIRAALSECIPSPSYWRTFSALCWRCVPHTQFIECWARMLLRCTVILLHYLYDNQAIGNFQLDADGIFESFFYQTTSTDKLQVLKDVWLNLFNLIGNPAQLIKHAICLLESKNLDPINQKHFFDQINLSFFIGVFALKKMINIFYGDPYVSIDLNESEELHTQWLDTASSVKSLSVNTVTQQTDFKKDRYSNMSLLSNLHHPTMESSRKSMLDLETAKNFKKEITVVKYSTKVQACQHVWYMLKSNPFKAPAKQQNVLRPSSTSLLELFLGWLSESALFQAPTKFADVHSQKLTDNGSLLHSSAGIVEKQQQVAAVSSEHFEQQKESVTYRRSIATSLAGSNSSGHPELTIMFGDNQHQYTSASEFPSVDGISSSRATAIRALCRIVCSKTSREFFSDEQLARFFAILHETLLSRDRLILCSILFQTADNLFKLTLKGIQIILPNYLMAIDLVHTESMKIPLHPSIGPMEMRATCLRALASILSWPSIFGSKYILDQKVSIGKNTKKQLTRQGSSNNMLEPNLCYNDLRYRMQHILVHSLRNEMDPTNVQYTLALSAIFCIESANYDLKLTNFDILNNEEQQQENEDECNEQHKGLFSISIIRAVISAICDNICKPIWANESVCCLAAFDCLNSLSCINHKILFFKGEISTGSLIVTSICRFIDQQLQKSPPFHSKDMHSTIVTAYFCVRSWLNSAPSLLDIESCLHTVAQTIELGMTGAHNLKPEQYKPASQRVYDAAELLLQSIFSKLECNAALSTRVNELLLAQKFGLQLNKFQHFLIHHSTLLSLHEAQHIFPLSKGLPTVIALFRTPFYKPWACVIQLMSRAPMRHFEKRNENVEPIKTQSNLSSDQSPGCYSITSQTCAELDDLNKNHCLDEQSDDANIATDNMIKQFEIPPKVLQPQCKLDLQFPKLETVPPQVIEIKNQLQQFRTRLDQGAGAPVGERDSRNVWLNTSLGAILTQPPTPQSPVSHCNSLRVFLYDMGMVNRQAYGKEFTPLDNSSFDIFYDSLSVTVDQINVLLEETVSMFYVKEGQRTAEDILQNNHNLRQTSAKFCNLLSNLGKAVETRPIGSQSATNKTTPENGFVLDGVDYCLCWRNAQVEISFITPTGRTLYSAHIHQHYNNMENARRSSMLDTQQQQQQLIARKLKSLASNISGITSNGKSKTSDQGTENSPILNESEQQQQKFQSIKSNRTMSCASACDSISNAEHPGIKSFAKRSSDLRIFVVWLERLEDMDFFPLSDILPFTTFRANNTTGHHQQQQNQSQQAHNVKLATLHPQQQQPQSAHTTIDHIVFYIYQFEHAMVRVQVDGIWTKYGQPGPLLNGTVVSMECLPMLLRQTVCNIARRRAIEVENYQMTHLRRKQAIVEFGRRFVTRQTYTDFIEQFTSAENNTATEITTTTSCSATQPSTTATSLSA